MDKYIKNKVEEYLTGEYHCTSDDLNASGTVFTIHAFVPQPYIKIMAYRNAVVVCTSQNISSKIKDMLRGKSRDEIFETPLVYGQTIHYIPDPAYAYQLRKRPGYDFEMLFDEQILSLRGLKGFENSLEFDEHGETPTKAVYAAVENKKVVGVAGVAPTAVPDMWEVGIQKSRNSSEPREQPDERTTGSEYRTILFCINYEYRFPISSRTKRISPGMGGYLWHGFGWKFRVFGDAG